MNAEDKQLLEALGLEIGTTVAGKYRIEALIASGGMGAVLRAHHEVLDQTVAIKVMRPELASNREAAQRFLREARAAAKIASDYVCRVTDVDLFEDATPYMVMEYLRGEDLDNIVEGHDEVAVTDAVDYIMQALAGLEAAHAIGVVHRDLKPSNLFLVTRSDGTKRIKVLDFGISKVMDGDSDELKAGATTSAEAILGTPRYMSPEQISSAKDVDARTDLWAIGLILYELLSKQYPFEGDTAGAILASVLTSDPPPLRKIRRDVPPELHAAIHRCLAKDRAHRFAGARQLLDEIGPFASRRVQALLLRGEVDDPTTGETSLDPDEMPTVEASVAAALGALDISQEELNALADAAAAREVAKSTAEPIELADTTEQAVDAPPEPPPREPVSTATANTALSIHQPAVERVSGKSRLVGVAAIIAVTIFAAGVWVISRGPEDAPAARAEPTTQPAAETTAPSAATEPAPVATAPMPTATGSVVAEPSAHVASHEPPEPAPQTSPPPIAAKPLPIAPKPTAAPVAPPPTKPKPADLDALLGERD